jgi:hypothetical protein
MGEELYHALAKAARGRVQCTDRSRCKRNEALRAPARSLWATAPNRHGWTRAESSAPRDITPAHADNDDQAPHDSVAVGAPAGKYPGDVDGVGLAVQEDECSPVADPQSPLGSRRELAQRSSSAWVLCEHAQGALDSSTDLGVQASQVALGCAGELDAPGRVAHSASRSA